MKETVREEEERGRGEKDRGRDLPDQCQTASYAPAQRAHYGIAPCLSLCVSVTPLYCVRMAETSSNNRAVFLQHTHTHTRARET